MRNSKLPLYDVCSLTVYIVSFNSNCRILAAELNYRFTKHCIMDNNKGLGTNSKSNTNLTKRFKPNLSNLMTFSNLTPLPPPPKEVKEPHCRMLL